MYYNCMKTEVYMKYKVLIIGLLSSIALPSLAVISHEQATDFDYLKRQGYSTLTADSVQASKARVQGVEYKTSVRERYDSSPAIVRWIRNAFIYIDPAYDDGKSMQHDIKYGPSFEDL